MSDGEREVGGSVAEHDELGASDTEQPQDANALGVLMESAGEGNLLAVKGILNQTAQLVDAADKFGQTALMHAAREGHEDVVGYLVSEAGADLNVQHPDKGGWTAVMHAAYFGHVGVTRFLVAQGADLALANAEGQTVETLEPCMNATKEQIAEAIREGLNLRQQPTPELAEVTEPLHAEADSGTAPSVQGSAPHEHTDTTPPAAAAQLVLPSAAEPALPRIETAAFKGSILAFLRSEYVKICQDLAHEPVRAILDLLMDMDEGRAPKDVVPLSFKQTGHKLSDRDVALFFEAASSLVQSLPFRVIDLSYNAVQSAGAKALAFFLSKSAWLEQVLLQGNDMGELGASSLAEAVEATASLRVLDISHNPVGDASMVLLARALAKNKSLEIVNVADTHKGTHALVEMALALQTNASITALDLSRPLTVNSTDATAVHMAKMLMSNRRLTWLALRQHGIQDYGAMWLAEGMKQNNCLRELDLSCNSIGAEGLGYLADALELPNCLLEDIKLSHNRLTDEACQHLDRLIAANTSLKSVDLSFTDLTDAALESVAGALQHNTTIEEIKLEGNLFGPTSRREFNAALPAARNSELLRKYETRELDFLPLIAD